MMSRDNNAPKESIVNPNLSHVSTDIRNPTFKQFYKMLTIESPCERLDISLALCIKQLGFDPIVR